ncbi:MAG: putative toxin-antitoxin system toxin component, PIN family [Verrucomicrobia bacterium]|nr:putative toxin-antitoxin system toxin component, PIN family [Verrucomicrobiota bacterium]
MKVVIDTNVFISGIFFGGTPYAVLDAWRHGRVELVLSPVIMAEYQNTAAELSERHSAVEVTEWLQLVAVTATLVKATPLPESVCSDPDDDKFIACALSAGARVIVTGDKALLACAGYRNLTILTSRAFATRHLSAGA